MSMPVLPALSQTSGTPGPVTDLLDAMSPEDIADMCDVAAEWAASAGVETEVVDDPDATAEPNDDTPTDEPLPGDNPVNHSEDDETLEQEAAETDEEQQEELDEGVENFEGLLAQVQSVAGAAEAFPGKFDELIEQATAVADQGGDPESVEELKAEAEDYISDIADLVKEADAAAKDEDAEGIAQAGLHIKEKIELLETLYEQAVIHAKSNAPAPAAPGSIPNATPALSLWAKRYGAG